MKKRGLFIGCNYYGTPHQTTGNIESALMIRKLYALRLHCTDTKVLADAPGYEAPTKANILLAMRWLCESDADVLLLHFSGIGHLATDSTSMVPCDYQNSIFDSEIWNELDVSSKTTLFATFDSQYHGPALDLRYSYVDTSTGPANILTIADRRSIPDFSKWSMSGIAQENLSRREMGSIIVISGLRDGISGSLSWPIEHLFQNYHLHGLSLNTLLMNIRALQLANGVKYSPQIELGQKIDLDVPIGRLLGAPM